MAQVELLKKEGKYVDKKDGKEKPFTNFYLRCGDTLIPVEPKFFADEEGHDYQFKVRKGIMSAFAGILPDKPEKETKQD